MINQIHTFSGFLKSGLILFALMTLSAVTQAQLDKVFINHKDSVAFNHIRQLKNSTLLVRLHTQSRAIEILRSKKRHREADILVARNARRNKEVINAFRGVFDFCDVYFFYSEDSNAIRDGEFEGIFRDDSLQVIPKVPLTKDSTFYIADFGLVYFQAFGEYFEGVAMMNRNFELLEKPFPYYVRKRSGMAIFKRTDAEMVIKLQENLSKYYESSSKYFSPTAQN